MSEVASLEFLPVHTPEHIATVAQLARLIWTEHYLPIIGQAQVNYMLEHFQSTAAIDQQLQAGDEYFLLQHAGVPAGYTAVRAQTETGCLFISKLYLLASARGRGWGRASLEFLADLARQRGLGKLWLTVNKHNPALQAYLAVGFVKVADVVTDIGAGYVMDDYRLEWQPVAQRVMPA